MHLFTSVALLGALLGAAPVPVPVLAPVPPLKDFTAMYRGGDSAACDSTYALRGQAPEAPGRSPVFVYLAGTWEPYDNASAMTVVRRMAERGYVAAAVQYPNWTFGDCATLSARSHCVFDEKNPQSAIQTLCALPQADCSRGIVVSGFSQGSILALLARDHDSRVRAAFGMSSGVKYAFYDLRACVVPGRRTLPSDRLRVVNGERDGFLGGEEGAVHAQLVELTGRTCPASTHDCFQEGASGWYLVHHAETTDGDAEHCYMREGGCRGNQARLDKRWLEGGHPWSLDTNLQWLTTFTAP